jgi:putative acetyltransferase
MEAMIEIVEARTSEQLDQVRALIRAFVAWHRATHIADIERIDRYFDPVAFEAELASLPGKYAPPQGALLLALVDGQPAGCVAMRDLGDRRCEMKRMFVPGAFRGHGVGRGLAEAIIAAAKRAGYASMRLDTSKNQLDAIRLYERVGFARTAPYYELSDDLRDWLVFYEKAL